MQKLCLARCLPRLFHLTLRLGARFRHSRGASLYSYLATRFLTLKNGHASLTKALFVLCCARFSLGNVGPRFFDGAFGPAAPFGQHALSGLCTSDV